MECPKCKKELLLTEPELQILDTRAFGEIYPDTIQVNLRWTAICECGSYFNISGDSKLYTLTRR